MTLAHAQAGPVGERVRVCVMRDAPGLTAARLLRDPAGFDCATSQRAFGTGDFWVIGAAPRLADHRHIVVRTASVWQRGMTLSVLYADGAIVTGAIDDHMATRDLHLGAIVQHALPERAAPPVRLLWHVEGSQNLRGIVVMPAIATAEQASMSSTIMAAIYAAFAGICTALLLYNLGLARALRQNYLPFYCLMMVGMLLYAFSSSGVLAWVFPTIANTARLRINYVLLAMTGIAAVSFLKHFFEEHVIPCWLDRLIKAACVAVALPAAVVAVAAPWQLPAIDMAYSLGFAGLIGTAVPVMACAWKKRSQFLWIFIIAWVAPLVLATLRVAHGFNIVGYSFWLDNSTILAMAIEALLSSLAIAHRILLITRERDVAREQEIAARLLADVDPLTGLMNRRSFLRDAIGDTGGRTGTQQLLLIDIDNFKRVNDTIGHDGGDEVLRLVARVLRANTGTGALLARIGGEEFAIVGAAPDGTAPAVNPDRLLAALRTARMPFDLTVTASIGVCTGSLADEAAWKTMYGLADRALFQAKKDGRDRHRSAACPAPAGGFPAMAAA